MGRRYLFFGFGLMLLLSACSEGGAPATDTAEGSPSASTPEDAAKSGARGKPGSGGGTKGNGTRSDLASGNGDGSEGKVVAGSPDDDLGGDGAARKESERAPYPAPGDYVYAQEGYEEFCSGPSCDRYDLARRQKMTALLTARSSRGDEITTEVRGEGDRVMRTTTFYSRARAVVTSVYVRLGYEGFVFENDYAPDPPIEVLQLPLREGTAWAGEWEADTSGSYEARVAGSETVMVGGRKIDAFKIVTRVIYRGEFRGTGDTQIWVEPKSLAVVKTSGFLRLKSNFGGYNTAFQTDLVSGPRF